MNRKCGDWCLSDSFFDAEAELPVGLFFFMGHCVPIRLNLDLDLDLNLFRHTLLRHKSSNQKKQD